MESLRQERGEEKGEKKKESGKEVERREQRRHRTIDSTTSLVSLLLSLSFLNYHGCGRSVSFCELTCGGMARLVPKQKAKRLKCVFLQ